ncbi:hypothetical protein SEA_LITNINMCQUEEN_80 [Gordonia phage LitninMcQueen]
MSDTPTPAEIAAEVLDDLEFADQIADANYLIAALSEHYHLLPKAEVLKDYVVAYTADNGDVIPLGHVVLSRAYAEQELAEIKAEIEAEIWDGNPGRYYVAQRLQSRWTAADVAEEPK